MMQQEADEGEDNDPDDQTAERAYIPIMSVAVRLNILYFSSDDSSAEEEENKVDPGGES